MIMRGLGEGIESEMESQRRIIANAARYLTDVAGNGGTTGGGSSMTTTTITASEFEHIHRHLQRQQRRRCRYSGPKLGRLQRNIARGYGHA